LFVLMFSRILEIKSVVDKGSNALIYASFIITG
jgi:hypothetical protein